MTETPARIDAAVEQVVKASGDSGALTEAVRALAGTLGYRLDPLVHGMHGGHREQRDGREVQVSPCGAIDAPYQTPIWDDVSCDGCRGALGDDGPKPRDGERGTCVFGCAIRHLEQDGIGWWAHDTEPADRHDAELGGSA